MTGHHDAYLESQCLEGRGCHCTAEAWYSALGTGKEEWVFYEAYFIYKSEPEKAAVRGQQRVERTHKAQAELCKHKKMSAVRSPMCSSQAQARIPQYTKTYTSP